MTKEEELKEEIDILSTALTVYQEQEEENVPFFVRAWRKIFGRRLCQKPKRCEFCSFWSGPSGDEERIRLIRTTKRVFGLTWPVIREEKYEVPGLCWRFYPQRDKKKRDSCPKFKPPREYTKRVWG